MSERKYSMKRKGLKITILLCFLVLMFSSMSLFKAYIATGHDEFQEITFEDENVILLVKRDKSEIEVAYKKLQRKVFGWSTHYFNINSKAEYVGNTLFSRSNRTGEILKITYSLKEEDMKTTSLKVSGSIDVKVTGQTKKKNLTGTINPSIGFVKSNTKSKTVQEATDFKMDIAPYTRVSLRITGDCYVTSAVSKYYLFGIQLKKAEWERVDVETMYYEMYEENLAR